MINDTVPGEYDCWMPWKSIYLGWIPDSSCVPMNDSLTDIGQLNHDDGTIGRTRPSRYFAFRIDYPAELDSLDDFLQNNLQPNDLFVLYSTVYFDRATVQSSNPGLITTLRNMGFYGIDTMASQGSFIFMGRNGDLAQAAYTYSNDINALIELHHTYSCSFFDNIPIHETGKTVLIYPNPSDGKQLVIEARDFNFAENPRVKITDLSGRTVYTSFVTPSGNIIRLDGFNFENGIYYVSVSDGKTVFANTKLVIEK
jgi:hypothetical protein